MAFFGRGRHKVIVDDGYLFCLYVFIYIYTYLYLSTYVYCLFVVCFLFVYHCLLIMCFRRLVMLNIMRLYL